MANIKFISTVGNILPPNNVCFSIVVVVDLEDDEDLSSAAISIDYNGSVLSAVMFTSDDDVSQYTTTFTRFSNNFAQIRLSNPDAQPALTGRVVIGYLSFDVMFRSNNDVSLHSESSSLTDADGNALTFTSDTLSLDGASDPVLPSPSPTPAIADAIDDLSVLAIDDTRALLSWTPPNDNNSDITDYEYETDDSDTWVSISSDATCVLVENLTPETAYSFKVRSINGEGTSSESNAATATTEATPVMPEPPEPSGFIIPSQEINSSEDIIARVKREIARLRIADGDNPGQPPDDFDFDCGVRNISVSALDPKVVSDTNLPVIFYGLGQSRLLNNNRYGTNFRGEVESVSVNIVLEKFDNDDHLIDSGARIKDSLRQVARNILNTPAHGNYVIEDVRLAATNPFSQGLSDREFMQAIIEVEYYYPI